MFKMSHMHSGTENSLLLLTSHQIINMQLGHRSVFCLRQNGQGTRRGWYAVSGML